MVQGAIAVASHSPTDIDRQICSMVEANRLDWSLRYGHPRLHSDPAHQWLRGCVREICLEQPRLPSQHSPGDVVGEPLGRGGELNLPGPR